MKNKDILNSSFISPGGGGANHKFRKQLHEVIDIIFNFYNADLPTENIFYSSGNYIFDFPNSPKSFPEIVTRINDIVKLSINPSAPGYMGHMDSIPTFMSIVGGMLGNAINNNLLSKEMSPFLSELDISLAKYFCLLFGYNEDASGVFLSGGSLSNLQALVVARNYMFNNRVAPKEASIICAETTHLSIKKAAMIMGIENIITIPTTHLGTMDASILESIIKESISKKFVPFAIVATAGSTITGNIDPIKEIDIVAKKYNLWLHVDAVYGGGLIFSEKFKFKLERIEAADSISFNPQKWLYISKTCSMVLFKNSKLLLSHFKTYMPYFREEESGNLGEISIQGSKPTEAIKLWLSLLQIGKNGYQSLIENTLSLSKYFYEKLLERKFIEFATVPETNIICFRINNGQWGEDELEEINSNLQKFLFEEKVYFSYPKWKNNHWLRVVILNPYIDFILIDKILFHIDKFFQKINK